MNSFVNIKLKILNKKSAVEKIGSGFDFNPDHA